MQELPLLQLPDTPAASASELVLAYSASFTAASFSAPALSTLAFPAPAFLAVASSLPATLASTFLATPFSALAFSASPHSAVASLAATPFSALDFSASPHSAVAFLAATPFSALAFSASPLSAVAFSATAFLKVNFLGSHFLKRIFLHSSCNFHKSKFPGNFHNSKFPGSGIHISHRAFLLACTSQSPLQLALCRILLSRPLAMVQRMYPSRDSCQQTISASGILLHRRIGVWR